MTGFYTSEMWARVNKQADIKIKEKRDREAARDKYKKRVVNRQALYVERKKLGRV